MDIKLCMGSSCFMRGNNDNLAFLEDYIKVNSLPLKIELLGCRCQNCCGNGPHIFINDKKFSNVNPQKLKELIENEVVEK